MVTIFTRIGGLMDGLDESGQCRCAVGAGGCLCAGIEMDSTNSMKDK